MFICIGIWKTRNTDDSLSFRYETFITFFEFRFFDTKRERETIFLCWLFVHRQLSTHWLNQRACAPQSTNYTDLAQVQKSSRFVHVQISTHCFYSKSLRISAHRFWAWRHLHPQSFPIWGFYCDICDCHILPARAWTPALMSAPIHALSRKILSLTKPKDKIYKTKNDNIKNRSAIIQHL